MKGEMGVLTTSDTLRPDILRYLLQLPAHLLLVLVSLPPDFPLTFLGLSTKNLEKDRPFLVV